MSDDIVERLRTLAVWWPTASDGADEIERLRTITRLQDNEIKMLRGRLRADAPFDAVEDYKQFRKDNPDLVTVDK